MFKTVIALALSAAGLSSAFAQAPAVVTAPSPAAVQQVQKDNVRIQHDKAVIGQQKLEIAQDNAAIAKDKAHIATTQAKIEQARLERREADRQVHAAVRQGDLSEASKHEAQRAHETHKIQRLKHHQHHAQAQLAEHRTEKALDHHALQQARVEKTQHVIVRNQDAAHVH